MFQKKSHKCDVFPQFGYFLGSKSFTCWGSGDTPKLIISLQKWIFLHRIKYDYTSSIQQIVQFIICIFEQKFKWQILTTFNLLVTPLSITKWTLQCAKCICIGNIVSHHFYWLLAAPSVVKSWNIILAAHQLLATHQLIAAHQLIATHQLLVLHPLNAGPPLMTVKLQVSINISNVMFVYKLVLVILLYNFVFYINYQLYNRQWWFCGQI